MSGEQERLNASGQPSSREKTRAGIKVALAGKAEKGRTYPPIGDVEMINRHVKRWAEKRR